MGSSRGCLDLIQAANVRRKEERFGRCSPRRANAPTLAFGEPLPLFWLRLRRAVQRSILFCAVDGSRTAKRKTKVGPQVSRILLAHLPELGHESRQKISALVGLALYNDDSGQQSHTRHIRGGRGKVRIGLYQAAVVAIRYCAEMKDFYIC